MQQIKKIFFAVDDDARTDTIQKNGVPFWLLFRWELFWQVVQATNTEQAKSITPEAHSPISLILSKFKGVLKNLRSYQRLRKIQPKSNLILTSEKMYVKEGGVYFNKNFYFLKLLDKSSNVFLFTNPAQDRLNNYHVAAYNFDGFVGHANFLAQFYYLFLRVFRKKEFTTLHYNFRSILLEHSGVYSKMFEPFIPGVKSLMAAYSQYVSSFRLARRLFQRIKPNSLFVEDANYGAGPHVAIVAAANGLGINTVELQHGVFDIAFQYGDRLNQQTIFREHKTKYLFTYGKHHSNYSNLKNKKVEVGNYYLSLIAGDNKSSGARQTKRVLIIDGKQNSYPMLSLCRNLLIKGELEGKLEFALKLHPYYSTSIEDIGFDAVDIPIYLEENIIELIRDYDIIISSYSTAIFETLLFHKHLLVFDDELSREFVPREIGKRFNDEDSLKASLLDCLNEQPPIQNINYYFEPFEISRISTFLNHSNGIGKDL